MFDEINGLPMHVLVIHGTVVIVPLAALLGVLFVIPRTHRWAQIPFLLVAVGAVPLVWVTTKTGEAFKEYYVNQGADARLIGLIEDHQALGERLFWFVLAFAVIAVIAFLLARAPNTSKALYQGACVLVIIGAAAVTYQAIVTGDSGSKTVWNPTDTADYSSTP